MQKLELTWVGKDEPINVEPRILLHDASKDYGDPNTGNMLIHGDNLLALKALEQEYAGRVKCIYIDPPFNTKQIFDNYDDNLEMSIWLNLMSARINMLHTLLSNDGTLFVHIDDDNLPYLTLVLDQVFGRKNRLYLVTFKQGSATGHKSINPGCVTTTNYILIYAKNKPAWKPNHVFTNRGERDTRYNNFIANVSEPADKWQIITLTEAYATHKGMTLAEARSYIRKMPADIDSFVLEHSDAVVQLVNPDYKSVGAETREYINLSRRNPGKIYVQHREGLSDFVLINGKRIIPYRNKLKYIDGEFVTGEPLTTLWDDILSNNIHNEGGVEFPKGKKPEALIKRCLELVTESGDLVLDSFLGSGTTAAVAQKMGRQYIGIEIGEQAYTHCKKRLDSVIDGEQGGISQAVNWHGGGGYKFYELAPTLIVKDDHGNEIFSPHYNPTMLTAAVAKLNGYYYAPDPDVFWKQGFSQDHSYIYVTTTYLTAEMLDGIADELGDLEQLMVCASAFDVGLNQRYANIEVRKIPQSILKKCEFGVDNYNLNIIDPPVLDDDDWGE